MMKLLHQLLLCISCVITCVLTLSSPEPPSSPIFEDTAVDFDIAPRFQEEITTPTINTTIVENPDPSHGCIDAPFAVCVGAGNNGPFTIFAGHSLRRGLVGAWDFNDRHAQDTSGTMNYARPAPPVGPGYGRGASAYFAGTISSTIPHQPSYSSAELSVSFWIFLIDRGSGAPVSIIRKGNINTTMALDIQFYPESSRIHAFFSTSNGQMELSSKAKLMARRWIHVAYVQNERRCALFINGKSDSARTDIPEPHVLPNGADFILGGNGLSMYLDDLQLYNRALLTEEVQAIGGEAYAGLNPEMTYVGCSDCSLEVARDVCHETFHLCSKEELIGGAMLLANNEGWLPAARRHFWHSTSTLNENIHGIPTGALCCTNEQPQQQ